jgi:hypothetical protein
MAPFCSPCASTTRPGVAVSARIPAGQKGRYRDRSGGTNVIGPRRPPELTHGPGSTQRIVRGCERTGRLVCSWSLRVWPPSGWGSDGRRYRLTWRTCEAVGLSGSLPGPASSRTVDYWMSFADYPIARAWYRAHNGSVVAAYLEHRDLADAENDAERFFMNVVLCRVL